MDLFGLPVYTSKWMPDTLIVMGNRGGKTLAQKGWEYAQKMADRQKREEAMPPFKYETYNISTSNNTVTNDTILFNPNWTNGTAFGDPYKTYIVRDPLYEVRAVEGAAKEETPEAWLKRRVAEICWRPV